jgi:hypothetical protein
MMDIGWANHLLTKMTLGLTDSLLTMMTIGGRTTFGAT